MIRLITKIPHNVTVACSGGVDSIFALDFISRSSIRNVSCAFFDHGTEYCEPARDVVRNFCNSRSIKLIEGKISCDRPKKCSIEEHWRNERYKFLHSIPNSVITGHNIDDCIETYIHSSLHGTAKLIPVTNNNVLRPFLLTNKHDMISWCKNKNICWYEDPSNMSYSHMRNYIRNEIVPRAFIVNPGLQKTIYRMLIRRSKSVENIHCTNS